MLSVNALYLYPSADCIALQEIRNNQTLTQIQQLDGVSILCMQETRGVIGTLPGFACFRQCDDFLDLPA